MNPNEKKLKNVVACVLQIPDGSVDGNTSNETVASWDSMNHLNLVLALEEQFDVRIPTEDLPQIMAYPKIKETLARCGVSF